MRVALAASYHRKAEMRELALRLRQYGVAVVSRWIDEPGGVKLHHTQLGWALVDLDDIDRCDYLVRFSDDLKTATVPAHWATGGRFVEMGYALAKGKGIIVVGGKQTIYDHLLQIVHLPDFDTLLRMVSPVQIM